MIASGREDASLASEASQTIGNGIDQVEQSLTALQSDVEDESNGEALLSELSRRRFTVFVLSEAGKPIFASCGSEEQLCSIAALVQTFVMVVGSWGDSLTLLRSHHVHICFSHRSPLILAIVSRNPFHLEAQLDILYKQVLSTLCRTQLVSIFQKKGPNFDLRLLLKGADRHLNEIVRTYRCDESFFLRSVRVFPMGTSERELLSSSIATAVGSAKVGSVILGVVIAYRQLVAVVRMKGIALHPSDLHILINLVECNPSFRNADNWIPICLPHFNDTGFVHAFISYLWEGSPACLILLSVERSAFDALRSVSASIVTKLLSSKSRAALQSALEKPPTFELDHASFPDVWHFIYKNRLSSQLCMSQLRVPYVNDEERRRLMNHYKQVVGFCLQFPTAKQIFVTRTDNCLFSSVTSDWELHCVMSPFVSRISAITQTERLQRALKKDEARFFISSSVYF